MISVICNCKDESTLNIWPIIINKKTEVGSAQTWRQMVIYWGLELVVCISMSLLSGRFGQTAVTDDKLEELELGDEEGKIPFLPFLF